MGLAQQELNASTNELFQVSETVAQAIAIQGGSAQTAAGAVLQLSQAFGSGRVQLEEFNSVITGLYPVALAAAKGIDAAGGSIAKLRRMIAAGEVNSRMLFQGILKGAQDTLNINNNLSGNKALGVVGNFDITAGTFEVSISATAYFSDVEAIRAVQENADITLDYLLMKGGTAVVFDMPMLSLGDGRPNVELDQPITLPLTGDAASGKKLGAAFDYTLGICFFTQLPALAGELYD
ncbi:hypothetical protein [Achromobacter phage tuull]|nr:hypothetical protein [Achromobacter phage tuull]